MKEGVAAELLPLPGHTSIWCLRRLDPDRLDVEIFFQMLLAGLAAVTAHLVAAERHRRIHRLIAIDPNRSGAKRLCNPMRVADILGPDPAAEAEGGGVGALDQFVTVFERDRRDHRPKDLLLSDPHIVLDVGEHCRRHEIALCERAFRQPRATSQCLRAFLLANGETAADALELLFRHPWPDLRVRVEAVADLQLLAEFGDAADEFVIHFILDEQPRAPATNLA